MMIFINTFIIHLSGSPYILKTVDELLNRGVQKELIDFDNYLDDLSQDWTNLGIEKLIASVNASNSIDDDYEDRD